VLSEALHEQIISVDVAQFPEEAVRSALKDKSYVESLAPGKSGEFHLSGHVLRIILKAGIYPHSMIGLREDGTLVCAAVQGLSNQVGLTVIGAASVMNSLGARDALLIDNGHDVAMGVNVNPILDCPEQPGKRLRSMLLFSSVKDEPGLGLQLLEFQGPLGHAAK
jgi:hypothetical protein